MGLNIYESSGLQIENNRYDLDETLVIGATVISGDTGLIDFEEGFLNGFVGTDGGTFEVAPGTNLNHAVTLAQLMDQVRLTDNADGTCTLQVGDKSIAVGMVANPPTAMPLDAGTVVIGEAIPFDLSSVASAGDDPSITYFLDSTSPKSSAVTLNSSTGTGSINTTGLVPGDLCEVSYVIIDSSGLSATSMLRWTQTSPVPTATITPSENPAEFIYDFVIDHSNLDGTETLRYLSEDGLTDLSSQVTGSGLPVGEVPASGQTISFSLISVYSNSGLQEVTLQLLHPTLGVLDEFVYPVLLPSGTVTFENVVGSLPDSQTADVVVDFIKVGTITTGAGYSGGGLSGQSLNGIHPGTSGAIVSTITLDHEFASAEISVINLGGTPGRFESIEFENTSNPSDEIQAVSLGLAGHSTTGTNPILLSTIDTTNANNTSVFRTGSIQSLGITQDTTGVNGSVITRLTLTPSPPNRINIVGDSRMALPLMTSAVEALNSSFFELTNSAVPGHRVVDFANVVDAKVAAGEHYDIAILMVGTNSAVPGAQNQMFADLRGAVEAAIDGNLYDKILLMNDAPTNPNYPLGNPSQNNIAKVPVLRAYADLINAHNWGPQVEVLDSYSAVEDPNNPMELNPDWTVDGLHFIEPAYTSAIAPLVAPFVNA